MISLQAKIKIQLKTAVTYHHENDLARKKHA